MAQRDSDDLEAPAGVPEESRTAGDEATTAVPGAEHTGEGPPADGVPEPEPPVDPEASAEATADAAADGAKRQQRGRPRLKLEELEVGQECHGKVVGLAKFGAFVDVGAVTDGLVHLTEFSTRRVRKPEEAVSLGEEVDVWIKEVDASASRISLSMRRKPKHSIKELRPGDLLAGVVTSTTDYGIFVDIGSDTEGLVHVSEISSGFVQKPGDVAKAGDPVEVRVKEIDLTRERISLSMVGLANDIGLEAASTYGEAASARDEEESAEAAESQERRPTVVELALRRALGEAEDSQAPDGQEQPDRPARREEERQSLGEIYERMLAEYRSTREDS